MKIVEVSASNFRSFKSSSLSIKPLSIIIGANGLGKSTLFHPLLLLKQSIERSYKSVGYDLHVNGRYISYGSARNAFYRWRQSEPIIFDFKVSDTNFSEIVSDSYNETRDHAQRAGRAMYRELEYLINSSRRSGKRDKSTVNQLKTFTEELAKYSNILKNQGGKTADLITELRKIAEYAERVKVQGTDVWVDSFEVNFNRNSLNQIVNDLSRLSKLNSSIHELV